MMDLFHQWFVVTTDEFAYPVKGIEAMKATLGMLVEGPSDGVDRYEVARVGCWAGVSMPTADDWGRIGEGAGCRLCCAERMDGADAQGRAAFVRVGVYCEGCAA